MIKKVGDWDKINRVLNVPVLNKTVEKFSAIATKRAGLLMVRNIKSRMRSVTSPPNHPITVSRKGSSKPWIDEGDIFRSVTNIQLSPLTIWIGVPEGKNDPDTGQSLAKIARVLEGGAVGEEPSATIIKRKKARALFIPLKRKVRPRDPGLEFGTDFILAQRVRIRPRPVIGPAVKGSREAVLKLYDEAVSAAILSLIGAR